MGGVEKALLRRGEKTQLRRWLQALSRRDIDAVVVGPASLETQIPRSNALVREIPAFAGPAAGILAGVAELRRRGSPGGIDRDPGVVPAGPSASEGWTLLLAVDLTEPGLLLDWLLAQLALPRDPPQPGRPQSEIPQPESPQSGMPQPAEEGSGHGPGRAPVAVLPRDENGRDQYLCTAVPTGWLLDRAAQLTAEEAADRSIRWLLHGLKDAVDLRSPVLPRGLSEDADTLQDVHRLDLKLP